VFVRNSPEGRGREAALCRRDRKSLLANPNKNDSAQEASGIRVAFSLVSFFFTKQKKETRLRVRERDQNKRRDNNTTYV